MSIPLISPSKTTLLITDEGVQIYASGGGRARFKRSIPWDTANFESVVASTLKKDCSSAPVLILNDMVEQHYRKERIPKVGALDKANVVRNRLGVAFPSYPIRAALPLNERIAQPKDSPVPQAGGSVYLFAAVPMSEALNKVFIAVQRSFVTISGFCLLPIEGASMADKLSEKLVGKKKQSGRKSRWTILIGQHRNGTLRQIVTRNGDLALTRLTPVVETDAQPELWASEVTQEFKATMSYLSRFGYTDKDQLDIVLIANNEAGSLVEDNIGVDSNFRTVTVTEANKLLGLSIRAVDNQKNADFLHVAWSAKKMSYTLPMRSPRLDAITTPRKVASLATVLLSVSVLALLALGGYDTNRYSIIKSEIEGLENKQRQVNLLYSAEVDKNKERGIDIELVQASLNVVEELNKSSFDPLEIIDIVGQQLGGDLKLDDVNIKSAEPEKDFGGYGPQKEGKEVTIKLSMSFPDRIKPEEGNYIVEKYQKRLSTALPEGFAVSVDKKVQDLSYTGVLTEKAGVGLDQQQAARDYKAVIKIIGSTGI